MNEQKNLLLAIVASLLILLIFQYFFPSETNTIKNDEKIVSLETEENLSVSIPASREAILEKDNAVVDFRELIGATDPSEAKEGTIRHEFAESKGKNAVHGSDSNENANIEADFHFSLDERF